MRKDGSILLPERQAGVHEECGIFGEISCEADELAREVYFGIFALQHRGQESAGIAVEYGKNRVAYYKNMGLVSDVFGEQELQLLPSTKIAIGHVRYSTTGSSNVVNAQPVVFYGRYGRMAVAHNGNIVNTEEIKNEMLKEGHIFQSSTDSEVIASLINKYCEGSVEEGIIKACRRMVGSYALVMLADEKLYAVRDPHSIRPLVMGEKENRIVFASESCALDAIDARLVRDIKPGELVIVDKDPNIRSIMFANENPRPCIFEYVYLARSDSVIDDISVYNARYECGRRLAKLFKIDADVVAGVPDSALVSARGYSEESGIPYVDAISKNRYIGRTFIQPSQAMRESNVKIKLNAFKSNIKDKRLILIDDSIVRGTTSRKIIQLLKSSGATEVHMLVCSPIIKNPCYFGIDMQTKEQLIGGSLDEEQICKKIGADSLHYVPLDQLIKSCTNGTEHSFCTGCFDGEYPFDISKYHVDKLGLE